MFHTTVDITTKEEKDEGNKKKELKTKMPSRIPNFPVKRHLIEEGNRDTEDPQVRWNLFL